MDAKKIRELIERDRPDLAPVDRAFDASVLSEDFASQVDARETTLSAWKNRLRDSSTDGSDMKIDTKQGLSSDEIRQAFAPRNFGAGIGSESADSAANMQPMKIDFLSTVKRAKSDTFNADTTDAEGPETKDLIIDESEGILGSQG